MLCRGHKQPRRCPADLPTDPGDEHWLLELCLCLWAQCNLYRGTSAAVLALLLFWLALGLQVMDLGQQKMAESSDQVSALKLVCILPAGNGFGQRGHFSAGMG